MQVDTNVSEADIGRVRVGQRVTFAVDAYQNIAFTGEVTQVRNPGAPPSYAGASEPNPGVPNP